MKLSNIEKIITILIFIMILAGMGIILAGAILVDPILGFLELPLIICGLMHCDTIREHW